MPDTACRSCGQPVTAGAAVCPHCGVTEPVGTLPPTGTETPGVAPASPTAPASEPTAEPVRPAGTRVSNALKALGCLVIALLVFGIALVVGVFDIFF